MKEPKAMDNFCWWVIEQMNFNELGHKGAGQVLTNELGLTLDGMKKINTFARNKVDNLYDELMEAGRYLGSDDGYSDLLWQIVANGQHFYENITVEKAKEMIDNNAYKESFAYAFHALWDLENEEQEDIEAQARKAEAESHLEAIRLGYEGGSFMQKLVAAWDNASDTNRRKLAEGFPELFEPLVD